MEGLLIVVSAASGAGKSTLIRRMMELHPTCAFSISHTTRPPRDGEVDGVHYHFVSDAEFDRMVAADAFAEWARVHQHRYGTSLAEVERLLSEGRDVVFDVDFQGGRRLMRRFPNAVTVWVLPPSMADLKARLVARGTDTSEAVEVRLKNARTEIAVAGEYAYNVVNDDVERCLADLCGIVAAERNRSSRRADLVRRLAAEKV